MKKKLVTILLAVSLVGTLVLSGCSGKSDENAETTVVSSRKIKFLSPAQKQRIIISVP